jgi:hypothetical protein
MKDLVLSLGQMAGRREGQSSVFAAAETPFFDESSDSPRDPMATFQYTLLESSSSGIRLVVLEPGEEPLNEHTRQYMKIRCRVIHTTF